MMFTKRTIRRAAVTILAVATAGIVPAVSSPVPSASAQSATLNAGGEYFPVVPERIFNSRAGSSKPAFGSSLRVPVLGRAGVPSSDVLAVVVGVTAIQPTRAGYLTVRPSGPAPVGELSSLVNFAAGENVPNLAVVGVGGDGSITIEPGGQAGGAVHVAVDVFGFLATSGYVDAADAGARLVPLPGGPKRVFDRRPAMGAKQSVEIPIRGRSGVPAGDDVVGVALNVTGINNRPSSRLTYLAVTPELVPSSDPDGASTSNGNYGPGVVKANFVVSPLSDDGSVFVYNAAGEIGLAVDVIGYFVSGESASTTTGRVVPLEAPFRAFDTRQAEFGGVRLGANQWEHWSFADFADSVTIAPDTPDEVVGPAQQGFLGNLGAVQLVPTVGTTVSSHLTMNPASGELLPTSPPSNSNLNFGMGKATSNMGLMSYGSDGQGDDELVAAYNNQGRTHYFLDIFAVVLD